MASKIIEIESIYRNPFYIPSVGKDIDRNSPIHVEEAEFYRNEELQTLVKVGLLKVRKTSGRTLQAPTDTKEDTDMRKSTDHIFGIKIPENFENMHWKQQRKILESIDSIDLFRIILAVAKDGNFKECARKRIIDLEIGKK
jgi:hypothetical protein